MKATLLLKERHVLSETSFAELLVWRVPSPVRGSQHDFKYRLAYIENGECILRYDNEAGKGDHRHHRGIEEPFAFSSPRALLEMFWKDVDDWRTG